MKAIAIKVLLVLALLGAAVAGYSWWRGQVFADGQAAGRAEVQAKWDAATIAQQAVDADAARTNAQETLRRLARQKENQDAQDLQLAAVRRDAGLDRAAADRLREQNVTTAKLWRDALGNPAPGGVCASAGDAIGVLADVLGRADRRAGLLAGYADAARAAGLKCERDYKSLTVK